jgi:single-strand DNA-binding protein
MATPITIVGNVTNDPDIRFTTAGKAVCTITVAVNERKREGDRWVDGNTSFFRVSCWDSLGENVAASVTKGMRVVVTGRLTVREYDTDSGKGKSVEITADEVGPSLRWATAQIERTARSGDGGMQGGPRPAAQSQQPNDAYYPVDEEPF